MLLNPTSEGAPSIGPVPPKSSGKIFVKIECGKIQAKTQEE